jgi:hypothetical protein
VTIDKLSKERAEKILQSLENEEEMLILYKSDTKADKSS